MFAAGSPSPAVTWWREGSVYDDTYEASTTSNSTVTNTMRYSNLAREDLGTKFTCQASNTNRTPPVSREVHISLNCECSAVQCSAVPREVESHICIICQ
jgi:hypothetical protein